MITIRVKKSVFNPHFLPILEDSEHATILLVGGGASGKSYFSFQRALVRCFQERRKYLICRKWATDVRKTCWEDVLSIADKWNVRPLLKVNSSLMNITFPNNSQMLFIGLDEIEKVKSIPNVTDIIIEECSQVSATDFDQLKQRMRGFGHMRNQMVLMTNPISKANWVYHRFFKDGCKEPKTLIDRSTYKDNPFANETTIAALENYKYTNPYYYRVYCLGEFGSLSKQVFTNYRVQDIDMDWVRQQGFKHMAGLDFGYVNDPTATVCSWMDEDNKRIYVYRAVSRTGMLNDEIASMLHSMGLSKTTIIADSAEQKSIDEIKAKGIRRIKPAAKGKGSVNQGIQALQQYELIVDPSCDCLLEELENYSWKKDRSTGEYINEPIDEFNHCIDSLRYSLQCVEQRGRLRSLPKGSL